MMDIRGDDPSVTNSIAFWDVTKAKEADKVF